MAKKDKKIDETPVEETVEQVAEEVTEAPEVNPWEEKYNTEHDAYLRLAAEFDNFRKRTTKEKEASYGNGKADAVAKLLPVYDNLERALNQPTEDAAYKKGVELTMTELVKILNGLVLRSSALLVTNLIPISTMRFCMWMTKIMAKT
jgi:molecular chaperone GrpE